MLGQVRFITRQKCFIRVRRLLCSDTSKVSSETTFSSFRVKAAAKFASAVAILGGITFTIENCPNTIMLFKDVMGFGGPVIMKMIEKDLITKLCEKSAQITELNNVGNGCDYVTRRSLEDRILQASEQSLKNKGGVYTIIVGAKGSGKTSAVARVVHGKKGVVALLVSDRDTPESIILQLVKQCEIDVKQGLNIDLNEFGPVLLEAAERRKGHPITIVFEVERTSTSIEILLLIKNFAKYLAVYASVIIVLSEANAGLVFGDDERQKIVWVDEMNTEEAVEYARKLHPGVSDADLKLLFDKIGKLPLKILSSMMALKEGIPAAQITEEAVLAAEADLVAFTLKPILAALKATPDGVHVRAFDGVYYEGVNLAQPKDVAVAMKVTNCLAYHMPSRQYRLATRAHRTALMRYNSPVPPKKEVVFWRFW